MPNSSPNLLSNKYSKNLKGSLVIPFDATIVTADPAIIMYTKEGSVLLSKSMEFHKTFNTSEKTLARPSNVSPTIYEVATYKQIGRHIKEMPESGNEIEIIEKGYMYAKDLMSSTESFISFSSPIFQGADENSKHPDPKAIHQTWMADCFLLSTTISLLYSRHGIDFFNQMMHQCDDGTTIVRLYHPITLKPHFIRVKNSYHSINAVSTIAHTQPWIHILEKAYAAFAFNSDGKPDFPSFLSIFGKGGDSSTAFKILTGKKSKKIFIKNLSECNPLSTAAILAAVQIVESKGEQRKELMIEHAGLCSIFKDHLNEWGDFLLNLKNNSTSNYLNLLKAPTLNMLPELPETLKNIIENSSLPKRDSDGRVIYPTSNGHQGEYTKYQYDLFDHLKNITEKKQIMTASTHAEFEEKIPGLVPKHEYAILGIYESTLPNNDLSAPQKPLLMVRLRNPWGYMGCRYSPNGKLEEEKNNPDFYLNISDFAKYFFSYSICKAPGVDSSAENNTFQHLLNISLEFKSSLSKQIEEYVKNHYPNLHITYSLNRTVFDTATNKLHLVEGFNIDSFIKEQTNIISQPNQNSLFQLNIKKYNVIKEATESLNNNNPILQKVTTFHQIFTNNKKILLKDPWYHTLIKAIFLCTLSILTAGLGTHYCYQRFFGKNSSQSKIFLKKTAENLPPEINAGKVQHLYNP